MRFIKIESQNDTERLGRTFAMSVPVRRRRKKLTKGMKMKVSSLLILMSLSFASISFGMGSKLPPSGDGSGRLQCAYYDTGSHEEHGYHSSRQECEKKHHGNCEERCFSYSTTCEYEGVRTEYVRDQFGNSQRQEVRQTYSVTDRDEYIARNEARRSCDYAYPRNDYCSLKSCSEDARRRH